MSNVPGCDRPAADRLREAVRDWDEVCDLDYRCPEAGRWPRYSDEYADWAWKHAKAVVEYLRATLPPEGGS